MDKADRWLTLFKEQGWLVGEQLLLNLPADLRLQFISGEDERLAKDVVRVTTSYIVVRRPRLSVRPYSLEYFVWDDLERLSH